MTSFRFIHAADVHIDSPLIGLTRHEGPAVERIRSATREAFDNLIGQAIDEQVVFVVIAGDLYDGDWRDFHTGLFFSLQMGRLAKAGIQAFVLYGNHDAESQITKHLTLPDNVSVFSTRKPDSFVLDELKVALHGQSFMQRDVTDNLVLGYPDPVSGMFNIGVLHTALGGMAGHENYAPCSLDDLRAKGYNYWALGHVHNGQVLHENPHVVFPGNLQGRHIRETGPKGAHLVTVEDGEITGFTMLYCDVVRWSRLSVPVGDCSRSADVSDRIRQSIELAVAAEADGRLLACRIELTGTSKIHGELLASTENLMAETQAAALGIGDDAAWIERLVVATQLRRDPSVFADQQDALGDLRNMLADAGKDEDLLQQLASDIGELSRRLPADLRTGVEDAALTMRAEDVTGTLDRALAASGCSSANVRHKPRLLSDNGPSYIAGELAEYIEAQRMSHVRGAPFHSQTQGKIERWHQTLKNRILLENYFLPGDLKAQIEAFVEHYNHRRYHESLNNVTLADAYFGRAQSIIKQRERIKRQTIEHRRLQHRKFAA